MSVARVHPQPSFAARALRLVKRFALASFLKQLLFALVILSLAIPNLDGLAQQGTPPAAETTQGETTASAAEDDSPAVEATATPTATPEASATLPAEGTVVVTSTITVTPEITATATPEASATPPAEETVAVTPTITATPAITLTATPEAEVRLTPTATLTTTAPFSLTLEANPPYAVPGEEFVLSWELAMEGKIDTVQASFQVDKGLTPLEIEKSGASFDAKTGTLSLPLASSKDKLRWAIPPDAIGPFHITATLLTDGVLLATSQLTLEEEGLTMLPPEGGNAEGFGGKVKVTFDRGSLAEAAAVRVRRPSKSTIPPDTLSGQPFEVVAQGEKSKRYFHEFAAPDKASEALPLTIQMSYTEEMLREPASGLTLFYYDEVQEQWLSLPTVVDEEQHLISAQTDHLTVFDYDFLNLDSARSPYMGNAQMDKFSGAATYQMELWTPPGPGGLQPRLTLSYNSQVVDGIRKKTQASWVGMGWSLDTGYIERNSYGTIDNLGDDTFTLVINGSSSTLLHGADGYYHTTDESFWRIQYDSGADTWKAWDKTGNYYEFGAKSIYPRIYRECLYGNAVEYRTWRWSLSKERNVFGQDLTYAYAEENKEVTFKRTCWPHSEWIDTAVYPATITYPNNRYQVVFDRDTTTRKDCDQANWLTDSTTRVLFQRSLLQAVRIQHDADGNGTYEQTIRKYTFTYDPGYPIFPAMTWPGTNGKTPALKQVQEFGLNNASLPPTTFTYGDGLHLTKAENGYGGKVEYTYDQWFDLGYAASQEYATGNCNYYTWTAQAGYLFCKSNIKLELAASGGANGTAEGTNIPSYMFLPGAVYRVRADMETRYSANWAMLGLNFATGDNRYTQAYNLPIANSQVLLPAITIPITATYARPIVQSPSGYLLNYYLVRLPARYRVVEKKIYAGLDPAARVFTYRYDEPAVNDTEHSSAAGTTKPYYEPHTEFRGHAAVQEVGPDGRVTTSFFYQDDVKKGIQNRVLISSQMYWDPFDNLNLNQWNINPSTGNISVSRKLGDNALNTYNPAADYSVYVARTGTIKDAPGFPNTVMFQFLVEPNAITSWRLYGGSNPDRQWGIKADGNNIAAVYYNGSGYFPKNLITNLRRNAWYVAQLSVDDDNGYYMSVWERDNPNNAGSYRCDTSTCNFAADQDWVFKQWTYGGNAWLDEYSEGRLYTVQDFRHASDPIPTGTLPSTYTGLSINWTRQTREFDMDFNGDGHYVGKGTYYQYLTANQGGSQYGNLTHLIEAQWDEGVGQWRDYRLRMQGFYPNITGIYLVGLPGFTNWYRCQENSFGGACTVSTDRVLSSKWYLYDGQSYYYNAPTAGKLTGKRDLIRFAGINYT
ncbi:MAG: hypothetical protein PHD58_01500, partial [Anaerolineales bacterium]|nr:hypothetical protein [Anaerolineales bacterium]